MINLPVNEEFEGWWADCPTLLSTAVAIYVWVGWIP